MRAAILFALLASACIGLGALHQGPLYLTNDGLVKVHVELGTPSQPFDLLLLTTTTVTYVISSDCRMKACEGIELYNKTASSTAVAVPGGVLDAATVAGVNIPVNTAAQRNFFQVNAEEFAYNGYDGVVSFLPQTDDEYPPSLIDNIVAQAPTNIITIFVDRMLESDGQMTIGDVDNVNCDNSKAVYQPLVNGPGRFAYWQTPVQKAQFGTFVSNAEYMLILDTSATTIYLPSTMLGAVINVTGATFDFSKLLYIANCSGSYPDMIFTIAGSVFAVSPSAYIADVGLASGKCVLLVENGGDDELRAGTAFLKNKCTMLDVAGQKIGFAPPK